MGIFSIFLSIAFLEAAESVPSTWELPRENYQYKFLPVIKKFSKVLIIFKAASPRPPLPWPLHSPQLCQNTADSSPATADESKMLTTDKDLSSMEMKGGQEGISLALVGSSPSPSPFTLYVWGISPWLVKLPLRCKGRPVGRHPLAATSTVFRRWRSPAQGRAPPWASIYIHATCLANAAESEWSGFVPTVGQAVLSWALRVHSLQ